MLHGHVRNEPSLRELAPRRETRTQGKGDAHNELKFPLTVRRRGVFFHLTLRGSGRFMVEKASDLVQGTLDMLILKTLALEPMHGYGIAVRLEKMSMKVCRVNAGSLFVALQRLQRAGLIRNEWKETENNRRAKYYSISEAGRKRLSS